jgi:hypothetical protein
MPYGRNYKTNPNVGLDPEALALASPTRNTIEGLVDYLNNIRWFRIYCRNSSKC